MTVPFWYDKGGAAAWDKVILGGFTLPGVARVEDAKAARALDSKRAKGRSGASLVDEGYTPAEFAVVLTVYEAAHLRELEQILPKIRPARGSKPEALSIAHPALDLLGISSCYVKQVGQLEDKGRGIMELRLGLIEFAPLSGSGGGTGAGKVSGPGLSPKDADNSGESGFSVMLSLGAAGQATEQAVTDAVNGALGAPAKLFGPSKAAKPSKG